MRNRWGYTLVELMTAIVIVGILAAVAIPVYTGVTDKARASEFIGVLSQIERGQHQYYSENHTFKAVPAAGSADTLRNVFGITADMSFFTYTVTNVTDSTFTAVATLNENLGRAKKGAQARVNQDGDKSYGFDTDNGLEGYTQDWK